MPKLRPVRGRGGNVVPNVMKFSTRAGLAGSVLTAMSFWAPLAGAQNDDGASSTGGSGSDKAAFNNHCRTCHSPREGDNRLGPSLGNIVGAKAGTQPGYANYSAAMKSSGIVWDETTLDKFIADPDAVIPNNNMKPFKGVTDPAVRKRIIEAMR
jgi:cytochrome c